MFFPRVGRKGWIVTDVYEKLYAIPVTIIPREQADLWELMEIAQGAKPRYAVRWQICTGKEMVCGVPTSEYHEDYFIFQRKKIFRSHKQAELVARRLNRAERRRFLYSGRNFKKAMKVLEYEKDLRKKHE